MARYGLKQNSKLSSPNEARISESRSRTKPNKENVALSPNSDARLSTSAPKCGSNHIENQMRRQTLSVRRRGAAPGVERPTQVSIRQ